MQLGGQQGLRLSLYKMKCLTFPPNELSQWPWGSPPFDVTHTQTLTDMLVSLVTSLLLENNIPKRRDNGPGEDHLSIIHQHKPHPKAVFPKTSMQVYWKNIPTCTSWLGQSHFKKSITRCWQPFGPNMAQGQLCFAIFTYLPLTCPYARKAKTIN